MKKNRASESGLLQLAFLGGAGALFSCWPAGDAQLCRASVARADANLSSGQFSASEHLSSCCLAIRTGFKDVEPEIKVDIFGNIYVTAIEGVPAGVDLWKSTDGGTTFAYLGQPDGAQCPAGQTCTNDAGVGGGDDSIDVSTAAICTSQSMARKCHDVDVNGWRTGGVDPGQKWEVNPAAAGVPVD